MSYVLLAHAVYHPQRLIEHEAGDTPSADLVEPGVRTFENFATYVWEEGLQNAHLERPLMDGNGILRQFGLEKGGRFLKRAIDGLLEWQFDHVDGSIEEAKSWLLDNQEKLGIPPRSEV